MVSAAGPSRVRPVASGPPWLGMFSSPVSPLTPSTEAAALVSRLGPCAAANCRPTIPDGVGGDRRISHPSANFSDRLRHIYIRVSWRSPSGLGSRAKVRDPFLRRSIFPSQHKRQIFGKNEAIASKQLNRLASATDFQSLIPVWVHLCNKQVGRGVACLPAR